MADEEAQQRRSEGMSSHPLAYDANGEPLDVPIGAVAWRVRRGGGRRGRPRIVFDNESGRQLEIPIGGTLADLIDRGCPPGRYRLEAVDGSGHLIPGCIAVTEVPIEAEADEEEQEINTDTKANLLALLARQQSTIERQTDTLARALEAAVSGYGEVRPSAPAAPVIVEAPAPTGSGLPFNIKPQQIGELMALIPQILGLLKMFGGAMPAGAAPTPPGVVP